MLPTRILAASLALPLTTDPLSAQAETLQVTIDKLVYSPAEVRAKVGDTVVWVNKDFVAHTTTVRGGWDVSIEAGKSASLNLKRAGTFDYYCRFHPNMSGRIEVGKR
jgi:plastocyanin